MNLFGRILRNLQPFIEHFPRVAMLYRYWRDTRSLYVNLKETTLGFKFIGNAKMEQGIFEIEERKIVKRCLNKADLFINIGANIGYYCCISLQQGIPTIAFEPMENNLRYLYKNIQANDWQNNIEVFPLALGNTTGLIEIYGGGTLASIHRGWAGMPVQYRSLVPVTTLDTALQDRFSGKRCFILVDIEGAEYRMLQGAKRFLRMAPKPIWMVEIQVKEHQPAGTPLNPYLLQTFKIFWDEGYESWTADENLRKIEEQEIIDIYESKTDTLSSQNFLFLDKGAIDQI